MGFQGFSIEKLERQITVIAPDALGLRGLSVEHLETNLTFFRSQIGFCGFCLEPEIKKAAAIVRFRHR